MIKVLPVPMVTFKEACLPLFAVPDGAYVVIGRGGGNASPGGPGNEPDLHEVGFAHIFNGGPFLADGGGNGVDTHRAAVEFINDGLQDFIVQVIEADVIHMKGRQGFGGNVRCNGASLYLGEVANTLQEAVGDTGRTPAPAGDFFSAAVLDVNAQNAGSPGNDFFSSSGS